MDIEFKTRLVYLVSHWLNKAKSLSVCSRHKDCVLNLQKKNKSKIRKTGLFVQIGKICLLLMPEGDLTPRTSDCLSHGNRTYFWPMGSKESKLGLWERLYH